MATEKLQKKRKCPECKLMLMHKDVVGEIVECPRCGSQTPLKGFLQQEKREKALKIIADLSDRGDLPEAVKFYKQSKDLLTPAGRTEATRELLSMFVPRWRALLGNGEFTNADVLFTCLERAIGNQDLEDLYAERTLAEKEWAVKSLVRRATEILRSDGFSQADKFFYGEGILPRDRYLAAKAEFFRQICSNKVLRPLTQEQATAVVDPASHVLVKARAGSGKTTTLTAKALFLLKHYGINPTEILLLTFNRNARSEIKQRLEKAMHNTRIQNVFTFHSLAYNLVNPKCEILFNSGGDFSTKALAAYVRKIVRGMWNPAFKLKLYWYFREEMKEREPTDLDLGPQEYLEYRRNLTQVTLRGEKVKSIGEKYIADCLCEHDIKYRYEEVFFWGGRIYRPDFTLLTGAKKRIVIEHWGIDEKDESHSVPLYWDQSWEEYRNEMEDKRRYWNSRSDSVLLETSICDLRNGRLTFEKRLADKLRRAGVTLKKLTDGELVKKVFAPQSSRVVDLFCSFILRAQKQMLSPADIRERLRTSNMRATKTKAFIKLAVAVYESYNRRLKKEGKTDFDRLLGDAIRRLENSRDIILWHPAWHSSEKTPISKIKWVLVDEYQDMSPLFQKIILAIKAKSNCSLYCVGDDWQAINGFAGADPRIFSTFRQTHNEAEIIPLLTTFRNAPAIVSTANQLMNTSGDGAKAFSTKPAGEVLVSDIMETPISYHTSAGCEEHDQADAKFMFFQGNKIRDPSFLKARYLKACNSIMTENPGKSFAVLSRTNALYGCDLDEFAGRLKKTLTTAQLKSVGDFSEKVYVGAVHSYKGLEADVVIILRCCTAAFPLLHPDNAIFEILDSSPKRVFEEEKRLFYVALTRAREKLIMLTETGKESVWLPPSARRVSLGKDNRAF